MLFSTELYKPFCMILEMDNSNGGYHTPVMYSGHRFELADDQVKPVGCLSAEFEMGLHRRFIGTTKRFGTLNPVF